MQWWDHGFCTMYSEAFCVNIKNKTFCATFLQFWLNRLPEVTNMRPASCGQRTFWRDQYSWTFFSPSNFCDIESWAPHWNTRVSHRNHTNVQLYKSFICYRSQQFIHCRGVSRKEGGAGVAAPSPRWNISWGRTWRPFFGLHLTSGGKLDVENCAPFFQISGLAPALLCCNNNN